MNAERANPYRLAKPDERAPAVDKSGEPPDGGGMEERLSIVEKAIVRIDAILPTLATRGDIGELRADMHKEIGAQTWKVVMFVIGAGTVLTGAVYFIARHVTT